MKRKLKLPIQRQPDDTTCGPTCLHAVYNYYGDGIPLHRVISEVPTIRSGGTLGVMLAAHALRRGYKATIFSYNIRLFDPTWFAMPKESICRKLKEQARHKKRDKLQVATHAYVDFLELGGELRTKDLTPRLLRKYLDKGIPVLTGLSSTYLYQTSREHGPTMKDDDVRGHPSGHFVILRGYDRSKRSVFIADPLESNPYSSDHQYELGIDRVICAILLGIITDDANLIIIEPPKTNRTRI